jgi:hypothetical protein
LEHLRGRGLAEFLGFLQFLRHLLSPFDSLARQSKDKKAATKPATALHFKALRLAETATLQRHRLRELLGLLQFLCHFLFSSREIGTAHITLQVACQCSEVAGKKLTDPF